MNKQQQNEEEEEEEGEKVNPLNTPKTQNEY